MAQVELLQRLADEPALRVRDLAERHRLAANTVSSLVQQLVESGLVTRDPDSQDRRAVTVSLTTDGVQALAGWRSAHHRRLASALDGLSTTQRRRIQTALPALVALVEQLEDDA
ncbi:MarR family transcriptional regulator [Nocardioides mangrovicus]|uniref:MarR family transcriptional regulator n=2 Tax=Nocardioides mangrovicus TaxID=2478913 RepID=A0A3L8P0R6_9ACTN|nr:MarR family transcriptional regulator [Nocardioides mangrovicus]